MKREKEASDFVYRYELTELFSSMSFSSELPKVLCFTATVLQLSTHTLALEQSHSLAFISALSIDP